MPPLHVLLGPPALLLLAVPGGASPLVDPTPQAVAPTAPTAVAAPSAGASVPTPTTHRVRYTGGGPVVVLGPADAVGAPPSQTVACWDNRNTPPVAGAFAAGDEIVDWGVKACLRTGVARAFTVGYRTTALDPSMGGAGAAVTVAFYEGTTGMGRLGTETARYTLTGLPGSTSAGGASDHAVQVDLGNFPFCYADGEIGYGFTSDDGVTMPLLTLAPNASLGTQNLLDRYSPGPATLGNFAGSFTQGAGQPFGSLYLGVLEDDGSIQADSTVVNGSGVNPSLFSEITPAELGTTWLTKVDLSGHPDATFSALVLSARPGLQVPSAYGELLVDLTDPGAIATLSFGIHALPVPKDTFILGRTFRCQASIFRAAATPILTNGLDVVPGF